MKWGSKTAWYRIYTPLFWFIGGFALLETKTQAMFWTGTVIAAFYHKITEALTNKDAKGE